MTLLAGLGEAGAYVIRVSRLLEARQVTADALRRRACVLSACVTLSALHGDVRSGQRECGLAVIELRITPAGCVVALLAGLRKSRRHVIGIGGLLEVGQMASHTLRRRTGELSAGMALRTLQAGVRAGQRKLRLSVVIESHALPAAGVMAGGAFLGKAGSCVVWIGCAVVIRQVAAHAIGARR